MLMFVYCTCCDDSEVKNVLIQIYEAISEIRICISCLCIEEL